LALEQLKAIALGLAALRQGVDQLTAGQQQIANEVVKLRAAEQAILEKIILPPAPRPPAAPAVKPAPVTPRPASTPPAR